MRRGSNRITTDFIKRKSFLKNEFKYIILKSVTQNKNIKPIVRSYAYMKLIFLKKKERISFQRNVCLIRGRYRSIFKTTQMGRHETVTRGFKGDIQNIKITSW
jgi:hypothetical protein